MTLFQRTLKTIANRHKCGDTFPEKIVLWPFKVKLQKNKKIAKKNSFSELVSHLDNFSKKRKEKKLVGMEEKLTL
jgi:hypothetical protein